jgi:D-alanyl-D-alanine carboxypeptidase
MRLNGISRRRKAQRRHIQQRVVGQRVAGMLVAALLPVSQVVAQSAAQSAAQSGTQSAPTSELIAKALRDAYPGAIAGITDNSVQLTDGRRMVLDDGLGPKSADAKLSSPDIKDMFGDLYPLGFGGTPTGDPGRARNAAFFDALYGDCTKGEVAKTLVDVIWLPKKSGASLKVTRLHGVAEKLTAVSQALDALPDRFTPYLVPAAGTYHCRPIAGTTRMSGHGYGIAIDIAITHAHYWRWPMPKSDNAIVYKNAIPEEIVAIFEQHGFIWGGKWRHHDTMHFEYRPELIAAAKAR